MESRVVFFSKEIFLEKIIVGMTLKLWNISKLFW